ncbi:MAG: hypothetical protein M1453_11620 [Acidobacteria bacterium]|nr:hypothetical protein [Acidobacteriota bacterium]
MSLNNALENAPPAASQYSAADVAVILREMAALVDESPSAMQAWLASAAALLGPQAPDRAALADLLRLIFCFDARAILQSSESHAVMARDGARDVIRMLAHLVLDGPPVDSDRFKEIVTILKAALNFRGRELFYPIRLSLAGRVGEGELDRVILLLDSAAVLPFAVAVKGTRRRILEFCAALD